MLFDSHVHLNLRPLSRDVDGVLARAREAGVDEMVVVGIDLPTSRSAIALAREHRGLHATAGFHPHGAASVGDEELCELGDLLRDEAVVALGEIGLDYYRDRSPRDDQRRVFRAQLALALERDLPVVIHMRNAYDEGLDVLEEHAGVRGVMHCFGGDAGHARRSVALGLHVSFAGPITFPKAEGTRQAAAAVPLERTLVETDCPFLAPQPIRGQTNEPAAVRWVAEAQAKLRGLQLEEVAAVTRDNARRLFGVDGGRRS
jgi:TatD DNase family protein